MSFSDALTVLRRHWFADLPADRVGPPLGGGLSGSPVLAVRDSEGVELVLKAFAERATVEEAVFVHGLVDHLADAGLPFIPRLVAARSGASAPPPRIGRPARTDALPATLVSDRDGRLWELAARMPGDPLSHPLPTQLAAAMRAVARIHAAAERMPAAIPGAIGGGAVPGSGIGPAPAVIRRITAARRLLASPWETLPTTGPGGLDTPLGRAVAARVAHACPMLAAASSRRWLVALANATPPMLPLIAVIRDLRASHVLFTPEPSSAAGGVPGRSPTPDRFHQAGARDSVGGIVDFHAAGLDTPATDVARLLGDWGVLAGRADGRDHSFGLVEALQVYRGERRFSADEERLVPWLAATAVVFGLDQWFRWVLVDQRAYRAMDDALGRIDRLIADLPTALAALLAGDAVV